MNIQLDKEAQLLEAVKKYSTVCDEWEDCMGRISEGRAENRDAKWKYANGLYAQIQKLENKILTIAKNYNSTTITVDED